MVKKHEETQKIDGDVKWGNSLKFLTKDKLIIGNFESMELESSILTSQEGDQSSLPRTCAVT